EISCEGAWQKVEPARGFTTWNSWAETVKLPTRAVYVSALPVLDDGNPLGFLILAHDTRYLAWSEAATRYVMSIAFAILAIAASGMTLIVARMSRREWNEEFRRLVRG